MKTVFGLFGCAISAALCVLFSIIGLYTAGGLAASQTARRIPIVGNMVGDRIEAWVLGASEDLTAEESPWDYIEVPEDGAVPWEDEIEWGEGGETPSGKPANGPVKWFFHDDRYTNHTGVDISVPTGTPVRATMSGRVVYAGWSKVGYGYLVVVQNGDFQTYYAHNSELLVHVNEAVERGTIIAQSGSTGNSTGPHIHYEVRVRGTPVDPCGTMACP
ncbi:MAG: M23 family metallopeptidase [Aggregatilineales bacterium]